MTPCGRESSPSTLQNTVASIGRTNRDDHTHPNICCPKLPDLKFGCQLPQGIADSDHVIEVAVECERLGYDSVWAYDHLSPFWVRSGQALECWTLLAAVAARTSRIKIGSLVTNVNFRNPALLAKMTSTLDDISGGRLVVGLGVGDRLSRNELRSYGYKLPPLDERIARLRETIQILKSMWTEDNATFAGKHFRTSRARNYPKPRHKPPPTNLDWWKTP